MKSKFKYQWYQEIFNNIPKILEEAKKAGKELGLDKFKNKIGLYPGSSSCPGSLPRYVIDAIIKANKVPILPMRKVEDELREVIKDVYGDDYDGAAVNTCESALRVTLETLFAPPTMRKGDAYRGRYIFPYHEDIEFMASYGTTVSAKIQERLCRSKRLGRRARRRRQEPGELRYYLYQARGSQIRSPRYKI